MTQKIVSRGFTQFDNVEIRVLVLDIDDIIESYCDDLTMVVSYHYDSTLSIIPKDVGDPLAVENICR